MAENEEIKIISGHLNALNGDIKNAKSPKAVQQEIFTYVRPLNTSLKKLYGFAPPPLKLDKLKANASSDESLKEYLNKYFSRWPAGFTEKVDEQVSRDPYFNDAQYAKEFVDKTLVPLIMLLHALKNRKVAYIAGLDLNSKALDFINNDNNLKAPFVNLINLAKILQQSKRSNKETNPKFEFDLSTTVKGLHDFLETIVGNFNTIIASQSTKLKSLATDRKKGSALYYLKETKNTGKDSTPPENTIKAFIKFLKALAKEFRKEKKLKDNIKLLQKKLEKMKNKN